MIIAEFLKKNGEIIGFCIKGHAGFGTEGNDIVCASVSSAVQLIANVITDSFKIKADVSAKGDTIKLQLTDDGDKTSAFKILNGFYQHIGFIAEDYQGTIKITISEV